ncbi:MAG: superoxide dismutase [Ni] [Bdellovibrionota bacterium]
MKKWILSLSIALLAQLAQAHCEIPCGIYDDDLRFDLIFEHIHTLEKSIAEIKKYEGKKNNNQQFVRWVINKEKHATEIQDIVTQYFLTQRIKPNPNHNYYADLVAYFHEMMVLAMQVKQNANSEQEIQKFA